MARADKATAVAELAEQFRSSQGAVLTEYRGLTVAQLAELREKLSDVATYSVVKNTLTKIAAREAGVSAFEELLVGPSAIAFVNGDPVVAAKSLRDFAKAHPMLVIKGGVLDGAALAPSELARLADLESREVLLAKLAGAMKASLSGAAALFQAPLAQAARTLEALRVKLEEEGGPLPPATSDTEVAPAAEDAPAATASAGEAPGDDDSTEKEESSGPVSAVIGAAGAVVGAVVGAVADLVNSNDDETEDATTRGAASGDDAPDTTDTADGDSQDKPVAATDPGT